MTSPMIPAHLRPSGGFDEVLRVLALVPPDPCGEQPAAYTFLTEELRALQQRGLHLHVLSAGHIRDRRDNAGIVMHPLFPGVRAVRRLRAVRLLVHGLRQPWLRFSRITEALRHAQFEGRIARIIRQERIDLVYSPFAWPEGTGGGLAKRIVGVPTIISLRGADVLTVPTIGYGAMRDPHYAVRIALALREADHVVAVSRCLAERAVSLGTPEDRVSIILKGVDERRFTPGDQAKSRQKLGLADCPTILFMGNFAPVKGLLDLLQAFELVRRRIPAARLLLCGDGPLRGRVEAWINEKGLRTGVVLAGRIDREQVPLFFRACDVLAFPSLSEGSGNALIEAAASGRPAVGTAVGGIPDYLDDGRTGLLCRKADAADLAEKLVFLLANPKLAQQLGAGARRRVEEDFRYDVMVDKLIQLFRRLVTRGLSG